MSEIINNTDITGNEALLNDDNNDDMVADEKDISSETSRIDFSVRDNNPVPRHTWTRKQKINVWIAAAVATVVFVIVSFC